MNPKYMPILIAFVILAVILVMVVGLQPTNITVNSGGGTGTPATTVVSELALDQAAVVGVATSYARGDHSHGTPTTESVQDAVGNILTDTTSIDFTYNDAGNIITATVIASGVDHNSLANLAVGNPHIQYLVTNGWNAGDMLVATAAGTLIHYPAGSEGYLLQIVGGMPQWATVALGAGADDDSMYAVSASYTGSATINQVGTLTNGAIGNGFTSIGWQYQVNNIGDASMVWTQNVSGVPTWQVAGIGIDDDSMYAVSASYTGSGTIQNLGTVVSGAWNGSPISTAYLGSGTYSSVSYLNGQGQFIPNPATANYFYRDVVFYYPASVAIGDWKIWIRLDDAAVSGDVLSVYGVWASAATAISTIEIDKSSQTNIDGTPSWSGILGTLLTIDANERSSNTAATPVVFTTAAWSANDHLRLNFVSGGNNGADLTIKVHYRQKIGVN